ncbi:uncharacterized protein LOC133864206 isoform X1 [Alnus glutinosa]|uniref:uncharacterized protein LOC133864206 isoform X1 n=1 Tax=Alnus glutinosa TaxID=3517 RepID=UPI002D772B28|nr:uncharacterized protein LOC133864206 isoform X1 [Alnus glutinosa]
MAASATASGAAKLCYSVSQHGHSISKPASKKAMGTVKFVIHNPIHFSRTRAKRSFPLRALDPKSEEEEEKENNSNRTGAFTFEQVTLFFWEDLEYLWKLLAGSVVGAAVIKYGSIVFPGITRPNIVQALIMISTPVIVAVFLLFKRSQAETRS